MGNKILYYIFIYIGCTDIKINRDKKIITIIVIIIVIIMFVCCLTND